MRVSVIVMMVICLSSFILSGCTSDNKSLIVQNEPSASTPIAQSATSQVIHAEFRSAALDKVMGLSIYVPPGYDPKDASRKYPVLYLLYGYGGDRDSWFTYLHLNETADRLILENKIDPLIIVSPNYGNSFGVNTKPGEGVNPGGVDEGAYGDYLAKDVVAYIDNNYNTQTSPEGRFVGGASMGGYAALVLGFTHPDIFSKIGAHSAAIWNYTPTDQFISQRDWLFPNDKLRETRDPFKLAEKNKLDGVQVYVDVGTGDGLAEKDHSLYKLLEAKGIDAQWVPNSGGHDMSYWTEQSGNYLVFYAGKAALFSATSHRELWKFQTGERITSSPLIAAGKVYFGSDDHHLYAVDAASGKKDWSFTADSAIRSNPKLSGSSIVFQSHAGTVYRLDAGTGSLIWSVPAADPVVKGEQDEWDYYDSSASLDDDVFYIGNANAELLAFNVDTGKRLWEYQATAPIKSSPIHDDKTVYFGDWEGYIYAVDKKNGELRWSYKTPPNDRHKAIQSTPVLHEGVLYAGARDFKLYAIDALSGNPLWYQVAPAWVASPIYEGNTLYVGNSNGYFMAAVDPKTGLEKWRFETSSNVLSAPAYEKGQLIFGSGYAYSNGKVKDYLYSVDALTGKLSWKIDSDKIQTTPAVAKGIIYYTSFDGALHALK
ncbi:outer membrane protein assembly factor BamB family protein [Cohnella mopanensis]|uniref:outer membrane protein assembly factor BamB family protein n=1 Tax=Cohnella mopanensis TaxID=2911966 RepID=UPI001EF76A1A|nr:PQQ-binding-like beta-propeller repeat protein [Cohnella mopanensis]